MLLELAEQPLDVARVLKRTPKKDKQAARSLYRDLRKRYDAMFWMLPAPEGGLPLRVAVYLNLVASHLAPTPAQSTYLFAEAAKVLRRAMKSGEEWTDDLVTLLQEVLTAVQYARRTPGHANIEQAPGLRPRARCDVSCKTCVHYLSQAHTGKGLCELYDFWTYKKWVCDSWKGEGVYGQRSR